MEKTMDRAVITRELLTDLKAKAQKATPGPWRLHEDSDTLVTGFEHRLICSNRHCCFNRPFILDTAISGDNAAYIAAANPQSILALLAELERLEREAEMLACFCADLCPNVPYEINCQSRDNCPGMDCKESHKPEAWREVARKAVEASCGKN